jgi:hypothetical protein
MAKLDDNVMKNFFLNLTRIVEANPRVYFAVIAGIALCLMLFIAEAVHIQKIAEAAHTKDQLLLNERIQPIVSRYTWSRVLAIAAMVFWSTAEYRKTKQQLGLK